MKLSIADTARILFPYFAENFLEQVKSIWFIVVYLIAFQILVLGLPIVYAGMIGIGLLVVAVGLMFFMEGLRLGLMPLGEIIGAVLPRNSSLPIILTFAFILGVGATFAEPAISVLRAAGAGVRPDQAPLLYSLLNDFSGQLVASVGVGVGCAVALGVLRFFYGWSLKLLIIPGVLILSGLTLFMHFDPVTNPILALAWDCGAVTTGPVTVPLVLALGVGVCRIVGSGESKNAGFGIVTLASLFPILAVLLLGLYHYGADDYYGQPNYQGSAAVADAQSGPQGDAAGDNTASITQEEFQEFLADPRADEDYAIVFQGGDPVLKDGEIVLTDPTVVLQKIPDERPVMVGDQQWDQQKSIVDTFRQAAIEAARAIVPLCLFLFLTLRFILREKIRSLDEITIGLGFALGGMCLFVIGIALGLTPLGSQLGSNVPGTFAAITPWGMQGVEQPLFESSNTGKIIAAVFAFFLGYGATLAEPALNALGNTVEKITVGAFKKKLLMQSVAFGVGMGIATGVLKMAYNIPLAYLLVPPYLALLFLTWISSEEFVNFGWDSAGVTTGPITVPLVLAMGLGIGSNVPGVIDGFGILALASVGPIITVLFIGRLVARRQAREEMEAEAAS
ncbi:MAG: DUF1538 domain-containing protein [Xanthomonadales bacterium]|nr:DUF1538 domain-containing protein [Xanthomonadales bacterium]